MRCEPHGNGASKHEIILKIIILMLTVTCNPTNPNRTPIKRESRLLEIYDGDLFHIRYASRILRFLTSLIRVHHEFFGTFKNSKQ
jgi:hypothetical protein